MLLSSHLVVPNESLLAKPKYTICYSAVLHFAMFARPHFMYIDDEDYNLFISTQRNLLSVFNLLHIFIYMVLIDLNCYL